MIQNERYWLIRYEPDLIESGNFRRCLSLKTIWEGRESHRWCEELIIRDWCHNRFGPEAAYIQRIAVTPNWTLHESNQLEFDNQTTERIILGIGNGNNTHVRAKTDITPC